MSALPEPALDAGPVAVLHLLNGEQFSGLERLVDHLVQAAPDHGFRLVLALLRPDRMRQRMSSRGAQVHEVPMRSRFDLAVADRIEAIAGDAGCRLVHSHTVRSALVARRIQRSSGLPWLHHVHSPALHESTRILMNAANFAAEAAVLRRADRVVTVSDALAGYVYRSYRVRKQRIRVIPNAVTDAIADAPAETPDAITILTLGLFRPRKGIEVLVRAAALLRDAGHGFRLRIAGEFADADYATKIKALVARLALQDRIEFLGFVADVEPVLRSCDIFVLPSLKGEGMPMAMLEAMALARPIVAADIDGVREIVGDSAGMLVPPSDAQALAQTLARMITSSDQRTRLGQAAQARQRSRHSLPAMQRQVFDCYRDLLAQRAGGRPHTRRS